MPDFSLGQIVALRRDPVIRAAIVQVLPGTPEDRYLVFHDGQARTYYASQLSSIEDPPLAREVDSLSDFNARLTALQLAHPGVAALYSLHAARVDFIPYQFRPVLKFINADRPRLLIADEVGVGKTIEAGLILREYQARQDVRSALVICPKPLVAEEKWQRELRRFDEDFVHIDGESLRYCIKEMDLEGEWPARYTKAILPFSLFDETFLRGSREGRRRLPGLLDLDPPPRFDLVIVDEAHAIRNANTLLHQGVRFLCDHAEAVVFLTATPIQLGSEDLFTLLNVLRPDLAIDPISFGHITEPNPFINQASVLARRAGPGWQSEAVIALEKAAATNWGEQLLRPNPEYQRLSGLLGRGGLTREQRVAFVRDVERLHTLNHVINRTRRRDIGAFTVRKPETLAVEFTPEQRDLHDRLIAAQARILRIMHGERGVKFMLSTLRRQAASSIFGLAPLIREILTRRLGDLELAELGWVDDEGTAEMGASLQAEIADVLARAESLTGADPKLEALRKVIAEKQALPNNKLLLFSSFRHTLAYLERHLSGGGIRIALLHGGTADGDRREIRRRFSLPKHDPQAIDVLFSSEIGSEGLDYQFCDALINYDLPWNPMRIEQRIGRIDRYGQKSEAVVIYNIVTPGTVDYEIYVRCLLRIGIFQAALGGSEEILGRIGQGLRQIAEDLTLTAEERASRLEQLADNEVREIQEETLLEDQQGMLFGISLPPDVAAELEDADSPSLTPAALQNLVQRYFSHVGSGEAALLGSGVRCTLRAGQDDRNHLLRDFRKLSGSRGRIHREWERWLRGNDPHLPLTFDTRQAAEDRGLTFITPVHPLALQAAHSLVVDEPLFVVGGIVDPSLSPGENAFAIYEWQLYGLQTRVQFQAVAAEPAIQERLFDLLARATSLSEGGINFRMDDQEFDRLERAHYGLWTAHREAYRLETARLISFRRSSLEKSHNARLATLKHQLEQTTHPNFRRMRQAQIETAEGDYRRRLAELDASERSADVVSRIVAFGYLQIR